MFETIVVPLDGSKLAKVALPYAEELAGNMGTPIILFSVLESEEPREYQEYQNYAKKIIEATRQHAEKYLDKSGDQATKVGTVTRVGNPAEGIVEYVSNGTTKTTKLIVMATHGRSGISRWAIGSIADKVVRATKRQPLMLVRAKGARPDVREKRILKKALVPLDGSTRSEAVIPFIKEIALRLEMELTLLQVVSRTNHISHADAKSYLQSMCGQLENEGITTKYKVRVGSAADKIIDLADELAIDVVAMATHGKTAVSLLPLGSVAQKVLLGGDTPLLLVRS